ncbi:hypothetical protein ACFWRZ_09115 [Streptomyces rubiginosohelvolus]|uniref:hypothetical protein n=1 Tax=Streptomyces rubiginosohelvolus TaxID=67362 RepID=UPI00364F2E7A
MTTLPLHSVNLSARVTTLLARTFPEYVPGVVHEGFRVESVDQQEPRRMFVRWHGGTPTRPVWTHGPALGREKYKAQILEVLTREGYAVTNVPGRMDVFVNDRPHDTSGPRFAVVANDVPVSAPWLVMDLWTRAHVATAGTEEEAAAEAMDAERHHTLTDARIVTAPDLYDFLDQADEVLGDGLVWLRREVRQDIEYTEPVRHERLDALVDVANALRRGEPVARDERLVAYETSAPTGTYAVHWVPESLAPAVGFFPGEGWEQGPEVHAAIGLLISAGLTPVRYGERIGGGSVMCEASGFMVSAADPLDRGVPGVHVDGIGSLMAVQTQGVPEALRAAGWEVTGDPGWTGAWAAYPPAE